MTEKIVEQLKKQDVRFVRLAFCDIFGQLKNISIGLSSLEKAMEKGVGLNAASVRGFLNIDDSDLLLFPDPETLTIIPWPGDLPMPRSHVFSAPSGIRTEGRLKAMCAQSSRTMRIP